MGILSSLLTAGLVAGASITAYQASEKTKAENGEVKADAFVKNFKDYAVANSRTVVDTVKRKLGKSAEGEKSDPDSGSDRVSEIFEGMKEKAPEVIGKVQDMVEDVREHAPEYKEKAQGFVEDVVDAARKAFDDTREK